MNILKIFKGENMEKKKCHEKNKYLWKKIVDLGDKGVLYQCEECKELMLW